MDEDVAQDAQMELKRRARRRLLGAGALALLAVVVLPMVMDHEPRPPAQDIQVRIPSQDGVAGIGGQITSRLLPGKGPTPLPPPAEPKVVAAPAVAEQPPVAATREPKAEVKPASKAEIKAEIKPVTKPELAAPAAKPLAAKPAEKIATEKDRAEAALNGAGESAPAAGGQWVVQLGAYKDAANVKQLTAKLKGMGVPSYAEKFDSPQGPRTRVRAGPFATKEAAEKAQAKAKAIGVSGPVAQK